jgi:hypothetical protein
MLSDNGKQNITKLKQHSYMAGLRYVARLDDVKKSLSATFEASRNQL